MINHLCLLQLSLSANYECLNSPLLCFSEQICNIFVVSCKYSFTSANTLRPTLNQKPLKSLNVIEKLALRTVLTV